jgi:predicted nucleotide-binding protein (sugar kinase/HSP70/actin superfamily)
MGVQASDVCRAMAVAFSAQDNFENSLKEKGREILGQLGTDEKLFVLVSRSYNGCDQGMNLELPRKLTELGIKTIPMDMLDLESVDPGDSLLHELMYWSYGQKILRAAELIRRDRRLFAIYLSNFSCGPDSFLLTFFKDIMGEKPCLQLEIDEHSADAGVITRLEAFLESLKNYHGSEEDQEPKEIAPVPEIISNKRTLYIPYMGDCAYGVAASLRAYGQPAEVMPLADEATLLRGRACTTGKECLPCIITTGDMLKVVESPDFDAARTAFFMPSASGPCRFGMYSCLHRKILNYKGVSGVPVIAPNQDSGFYQQLSRSIKGSGRGGFLKDMWTAVAGIDLLSKLLLRLRPFASDRYHVQQVYDKLLGQWIEAVEQRRSLSDMVGLMGTIADYFGSLRLDRTVIKPRIGIVGEIYVRSHPFSNMNLVRRLEDLGAACDLASLAEWIYYTNYTRSCTARRRRHFRDLLTEVVKNSYQRKIEKALAVPLEKRFGRLAEGPVEHVLELARPYLHESFEGEAVLSVGKIVEYHREGFGGVLNVMPFSCMPSTVVSTQTRRISSDCDDMPILNLSFDGQEDPTMMTRLEAFVEQVRQRQCGNATFSQIAAVTA